MGHDGLSRIRLTPAYRARAFAQFFKSFMVFQLRSFLRVRTSQLGNKHPATR